MRAKYRIIRMPQYYVMHKVQKLWLGHWWSCYSGNLHDCEEYLKKRFEKPKYYDKEGNEIKS